MTPVLLRLQKGQSLLFESLQDLHIPAVQLDDDLAVAVVVDLLELANVAWIQISICRERLNVPHQPKIPKTCKILAVKCQSSEHLKGVGRGAV